MPHPRQMAEDGEVEDGELPASSSSAPAANGQGNGNGASHRGISSAAHDTSKRPSIQIGLSKPVAGRNAPRPSLFDEDSLPRANRIGQTPSGLSIKGAAVGGPSSDTSTSNGHGLNIKGRSHGSNEDFRQLGEAEIESTSATGSASMPTAHKVASPASRGLSVNQMSMKPPHPSASLPPKPRMMAMPFKMKGAAASSTTSGPSSFFSSPVPQQAPSNAIGKGYANVMIAPKIPSSTEPGPSFTPPPRHENGSQPRPPYTQSRAPSPPLEARPPSPAAPPPPPPRPSSLPRRPSTSQERPQTIDKGKAKEQEQEEGEELEEGEEIAGDVGDITENRGRQTPGSRSSPFQQSDSMSSARPAEKHRREDDDDRRQASFGRSQGDHWESSYRSPRSSRYYDRGYDSSTRRHRDHDDGHKSSKRRNEDDNSRRSGYDSYGEDGRQSYRDGDKSRDRRHTREYGRDRDHEESRTRERDDRSYHSRRPDQSGSTKGNVWRRGSSYSPDDPDRRTSKRAPDFHDEPGAPRHFDRELASARKSLPSTPSLPAKPVAGLPERPGAAHKAASAIIPPLPQAATPFFLPTPPRSAPDKIVSPWEDEAEEANEVPTSNVPASSSLEMVGARSFTLFGASALSQYILEEKLGEGTFGVVHKARRKESSVALMPAAEHERRFRKAAKRRSRQGKETNEHDNVGTSRVNVGDVVALKKIVMHNDMDGVPITALREIRILKTLHHPNVVPVVDTAYQSGDHASFRRGAIYMVFPYMAHDLAGLLENKKISRLDQALLKLYSRQLLLGTSYLHRNKILHRDMKAANLLISDDGVLQIADFGLARSVESQTKGKRREYTNCVVTRWYRPPELLLGLRAYGPAIDMWGVGCVIGEMFFRHPVFTGSSDLDQISRIVQMCGTIDDISMPGWDSLPESNAIQIQRGARNVKREFSRFSDELADLLDKLLVYDPEIRLTADQALDHDWFWTEPLSAAVGSVRAFPSSHEYDKRKAVEERQGQGGEKARAAEEAAFKGSNHTIRPAAPVQKPPQPPVQQPGPPMPTMQADAWGNRPPVQGSNMQQPAPQPMMVMQPARAGLPPRPVAPQGFLPPQQAGYPNAIPMGGYPTSSGAMGMMAGNYATNMANHVPNMAYSHAAPMSMRPQERFLMPPGTSKEMAIAGRSSQGWDRNDPAAKRQRLASPPGRLMGGIAGRSRIGEHADNMGGQGAAFRPPGGRHNASAYDDKVPAGSAEPLD